MKPIWIDEHPIVALVLILALFGLAGTIERDVPGRPLPTQPKETK
jgi:hypothetical protein